MNNCNIYHYCQCIPACIPTLKVQTSVISGSVLVVIVDKFDRSYEIAGDTDVEGVASVDLTDIDILPISFLNQYSGLYKLKVLDSDKNTLYYRIDNVLYGTIEFKVCEISPVPEDYLITV